MEKLRLIKSWKALLLLVCMSMFSASIFAQGGVTLKGRVVDQQGGPLIGAKVAVTASPATATATNVTGDFILRVPANTTKITISYIGYVTLDLAVPAGKSELGQIALATDQNNLSEVVVVGYGTVKKADVTGTAVTVDAKALQEVPASNAFDQLKGRVAGVDITDGGNGPVISIRGNRTIYTVSNNNTPSPDGPLIVLDGQPYYNSIENIDPNDIKNIEVLKGASATAIYGSRGSGGVLLITTNRGRVGQTVTAYDSYYGYSRLEGGIRMLNGQQFAQLQTDAAQGTVIQSNNPTATPGPAQYGLSSAEQAALAAGVSTNWAGLITQPAAIWDNSLRVSGGSESTQFTVGASYRTQTAVEPNQGQQRISLNATIDHKINKVIKFGVSTETTLRLINTGAGDQLTNARHIVPLANPYNPDGSYNLTPEAGLIDATTLNPLFVLNSPAIFYNKTRGLVNNDILYAELTPIAHLKYRYSVNYNNAQSLQGVYNGIDGVAITSIAKTSATTTNNLSYRVAQEHLLTYDNTFGKHSVNFVAAFTNELATTQNSSVSGTGIPSDANVNSNLNLAQVITGTPGSYSQQGLVSYLARINYAYDNRYDLTATIRSDANSALAAGHQTTYYPSVGLGWVISNEKFMKKYDFVDNLKLRGGYGITSTTNTINPYSTLGALSTANYQYGGTANGDAQGVRVTSLVNTALTWQRTSEYNLALDFTVLKGRLNGSVEVYSQKTTGIILNNQLPITNGASSQQSNLGSSADKGLEITLSSINIQNKGGFSWSTDYNMAFSREHIVALPNGSTALIGSGEFVGSPLNVIYDVKKLGIWQESERAQAAAYGQYPGQIKVQDVNGDGKINAADDQIIGTFQPQYTLGMTNRFSYKNFDLSIVIQGRMGFTTVVPYVSSSNSNVNGWQFLNLGRGNQPYLNYWTPTNPTNAFPEPNSQAQSPYYSTLQYYDGSFIRAKSINVGFNVPSNLAKKAGMSSLRIYANVTNPFVIYAPIMHQGFSVTDPESVYGVLPADPSVSGNIAGMNGGNGGNGFRSNGISAGTQTRDFIIGINARF
jgi:TonB-linked SusC/RagA family outer membrane protein